MTTPPPNESDLRSYLGRADFDLLRHCLSLTHAERLSRLECILSAMADVRRDLGLEHCEQHRGFWSPSPHSNDESWLEHVRYNLRLTPTERLTQNTLWVAVFHRVTEERHDDEAAAFPQSFI